MTQVGTPSQFQKDHKILVSCMAAYPSRPPGLLKLIESCEKFGVKLTIFGEGEQFINMYENKLKRLGECLWPLRDEYEYIINIDAADTLFLRPLEEMGLTQFHKNVMIFAGEKNQFPFEELLYKYSPHERSKEYPYLNGGGFLSEMSRAVQYFGVMDYYRRHYTYPPIANEFTDYFRDDQGAWAYEYKKGLRLMIDSSAEVFQTLCLVDQEKDLMVSLGKLWNRRTFTYPFILHANGSSDYQNIYEKIILNA